MLRAALAITFACLITTPATAKPTEVFRTNATDTFYPETKPTRITRHKYQRHYRTRKKYHITRYARRSLASGLAHEVTTATHQVIGGRPAGCPHRFCGCALSIRVFGRSVRELWLASNWFRFPRASPASGMVAVRRGHVFQLQAHVGGNVWQVWDPNSGRGRIRIHPRSIAGYAIVNPHTRMAHGSPSVMPMREASAYPQTKRKTWRQATVRPESRSVPAMLAFIDR